MVQYQILQFRKEALLLLAVNSVINSQTWALSNKGSLLDEEWNPRNTTLATLLLETWTKYSAEPRCSDFRNWRISFSFVHPAWTQAEHQFPLYDSLYFSPGNFKAVAQWQYAVSGGNIFFAPELVMDLSGSYLNCKPTRLFTSEECFSKTGLLPVSISIAGKCM
jgi:hypothetical protein